MVVRLRLSRSSQQLSKAPGTPVEPAPGADIVTWREMAVGLASLLSPAAAMCFALAFWRLGQDMGFARNFFITDGPLSHWQMWFGAASVVLGAGQWLNRRARGTGEELDKIRA